MVSGLAKQRASPVATNRGSVAAPKALSDKPKSWEGEQGNRSFIFGRRCMGRARLPPAQVSFLAVRVSTTGILLLGPHSLGNKAIFCHQPCKVLPDEDQARSAASLSPSCRLFKCSVKSSPKHTALGVSHGTAGTAHWLGRMRGRPCSPHPLHVSACKHGFFKAGGPRGP